MSELVEQIFAWIAEIILALGYPGVFLLMIVELIFPPFPSELILPFAGFIAGEGQLSFIGILVASTLGVLTGSLGQYYLGKKLGHQRVKRFVCKYGKFLLVSGKDLDQALESFEKRGKWTILVSRVVPGLRSVISIPAGVEAIDLKAFILLTLAGAFMWNLVLASAGYFLGRNWQQVLEFLDAYQNVVLVVLGAALVYFIARRIRSRSNPQEGCEDQE